ncbi:ThiF family adenylyltransferase (plasmid) [Candidatus Chlorohelix allophototropha]|nr:ThiF family adenylyltransferase [Chloroflexota bacterium L227-S17]
MLVGCGGTGSYLAVHLARLTALLRSKGKAVTLAFIDPDFVAEKNIERQHFCRAEISRSKAVTLARRYGAAWGLEIVTLAEPCSRELVSRKLEGADLELVVGCVDNAAARHSIAEWLPLPGWERQKQRWWLDSGNEKSAGQVCLGNCSSLEELRTAFELADYCTRLPSPALQFPDLLKPRKEETQTGKLSCAELALLNEQGLTINAAMAGVAADYLFRLMLTRDLKRFCTWLDLGAGTMSSRYTSREGLRETLELPEGFFDREPGK